MKRSYTPEQQRWFRVSPHAEQVRTTYALHAACPGDPGAYGCLLSAIEEAERHPAFPDWTQGETES